MNWITVEGNSDQGILERGRNAAHEEKKSTQKYNELILKPYKTYCTTKKIMCSSSL